MMVAMMGIIWWIWVKTGVRYWGWGVRTGVVWGCIWSHFWLPAGSRRGCSFILFRFILSLWPVRRSKLLHCLSQILDGTEKNTDTCYRRIWESECGLEVNSFCWALALPQTPLFHTTSIANWSWCHFPRRGKPYLRKGCRCGELVCWYLMTLLGRWLGEILWTLWTSSRILHWRPGWRLWGCRLWGSRRGRAPLLARGCTSRETSFELRGYFWFFKLFRSAWSLRAARGGIRVAAQRHYRFVPSLFWFDTLGFFCAGRSNYP